MKYSEFKEGDNVWVTMPQGSGFEHPQKAKVIEKGADGVVLFERESGHRWWSNSRRIQGIIKDE